MCLCGFDVFLFAVLFCKCFSVFVFVCFFNASYVGVDCGVFDQFADMVCCGSLCCFCVLICSCDKLLVLC